jgi:hypothetical protein
MGFGTKEIQMPLLKYLLSPTGWGLLAPDALPVFKNLYQVVQYHRQSRRVAPGFSGTSSGTDEASTTLPLTGGALVERPRLNWTAAPPKRASFWRMTGWKWGVPAGWLLLILAGGIVVVPRGMGSIRVSQTAGTRPGTLQQS